MVEHIKYKSYFVSCWEQWLKTATQSAKVQSSNPADVGK